MPGREGARRLDWEAYQEIIERQMPFNRLLGIKLHGLEQGFCSLLLPFKQELVGDHRTGALHGGVLSTLIDTCGGFAVWSLCAIDDRVATIDLRVDYMKPGPRADIVAESRVMLMGNRVGTVHTQVFPLDKPLSILAEGRSVYNVGKKVTKKEK